ncbi:MAG: hypothetical protein V6Z86_09700 [Hyphomicrobiales bacterium]
MRSGPLILCATPTTTDLHGTKDRDLILPGQTMTLANGFHLHGPAGDDILIGGDGDDTLMVHDTGFAWIDGGAGIDTLIVQEAGITLDARALGGGRVTRIEGINIQFRDTERNSILDLTEFMAAQFAALSDAGAIVRISGNHEAIVHLANGMATGLGTGIMSDAGAMTWTAIP